MTAPEPRFAPEVLTALANLRTYAGRYPSMGLSEAINALDNAGVFAPVDEQTDYASAEELLAEGAAIAMVARSNPEIPADRALQVLHDTWHPGLTETVGQYARRVSGGEHEHIFNSPHSDEVCYADPNCGMTYRQFRAERSERTPTGTGHDSSVCDAGPLASPSLHSGTCPTWARHHNL